MPPAEPPSPDSIPPFARRVTLWRDRLDAIRLKEYWWKFLDLWESRRWLRRTAYAVAALVVVALGLRLWVYPLWLERNVLRMARTWIAAGKLPEAATSTRLAMDLMPDRPEPWLLAAEICRLNNQKLQAVAYARRAFGLEPGNPDLAIAWAAEALRANMNEEAERALARLDPAAGMNSAHALRLRGELARRNLRLTVAQACFEAAKRLEGPQAINEVPLGLVLIRSTDAALRRRGLALLGKWTADDEWGPAALRTLLEDATAAGDHGAMRQWAEALRVHPRVTVGDMPKCLFALHQADPARYRAVLADLERDHAVTPQAAVQLLGWLAQIGRQEDAVRWLPSLPPAALKQPPLAVLAAEAYRATGAWTELAARISDQHWGREFEFLRWAYALQCAQVLGQNARADELWRSLLGQAELNGVHAIFAASSLYSWGLTTEAVQLWWKLAEHPGRVGRDALAALARHYQLLRDADGQYRAFRQLHSFHPQDRDIANNFAFFALLTGREQRQAEAITRDNLQAVPASEVYAATRAFALVLGQRPREALALTAPRMARPFHSSAVTFAHALALAAGGSKAEAQKLFATLPPESLTHQESELFARLLSLP